MLFAVRHILLLICIAATVAATLAIPADSRSFLQQQVPLQPLPAPQTIPAPPAPVPQVPTGPVIVLDPAHGGTDTGARGPDGVVEKDLVLQIAKKMRTELEQRGYRVITTRGDDSDPSYDDRAGIANAYPGAVFVSIHISSTGTPGTVRVYYDRFGTVVMPAPSGAAVTGVAERAVNPQSGSLIDWHEAQRTFVEASHRLASLIQVQLTQLFPGSPLLSSGAAIRALRSIDEPAVAIELSSVSAASPDSLAAAATPLARAIAASVVAFRQGGAIGAR
jgi:N-acetylmuramoyl-L-alanine amidase